MSLTHWVLIDTFLFNILALPFFTFQRYYKNRIVLGGNMLYSQVAIYLVWLFCVIDMTDGDYFHLAETFKDLSTSKIDDIGLEPVYNWLIRHLGYSNFLFRTVVWGSALFLYVKILKMLGLYGNLGIMIFVLFELHYFSYARVSLALCVFLYGYVMILMAQGKLKKMFGIGVVALSLIFHKTVIVLIPLGIISLIPLNIYILIPVFLAYPMFSRFFGCFIEDLILQADLSVYAMRYLDSSREEATSFRSLIMNYLYLFPITCFLFRYLWLYHKKKIPLVYRHLFIFACSILFLAFLFQAIDFGSSWIHIRIQQMSYLPICLLVTYYLSQFGINRKTDFLCFVILLSDNIHFAYMYYLKSIGLGV